MSKDIKTPFGKIKPEVSLFPIYYLIFIYGFVYISLMEKFDWIVGLTGLEVRMVLLNGFNFSNIFCPLYWPTHLCKAKEKERLITCVAFDSFVIFCNCWRRNKLGRKVNWYGISTTFQCQGETNFHNLPFFHNYLLDPVFEISCISWLVWLE